MNRNLLVGLGIFLAVIVSGLFLVKKPTPAPATKNMPVPQSSVVEKTVTDDKNVREITITGTEYSYNPASISLKKGEKIILTFVNAGSLPHDLVIDELNVKTKLVSRGKSDTVEFTAEKDLVATFYCSVGNHQELGMEGELTIQ